MDAPIAKFINLNRRQLAGAVTLLVCFLLSGSSLANPVSVAEIRASIRDDVREVVLGLDSEALVAVDLNPEVRGKTKLPGTNVTLDEMILSDESGLPKIKSIDITILTTLGSLPAEAESIIKKQAGMYSKTVKISIQPRISGFKKSSDPRLLDLDPLKKSFESFGQRLVIGIFILAGAILLLLFAMIDIARQNRRQIQAVVAGTQGLVQALESQGGGSSQMALASQEKSGQGLLGAGAGTNDVFSEMSDAGIAAIISDAYWCKQDGYAASVWRRLPIGRKQVLLNGLPYARDYATFLSSIPESEGAWEQHPYYLNPLPIWNVSNEELAQQVRQSPGLLGMLPPMRMASLPMDSSEILALRHSGSLSMKKMPDLSMLPASTPRELSGTVRIVSRNDDDDEKLLSLPDVSLDDMRQIVSLVWITKIDDERVKDILKGLSATDIAAVWIGPEAVLRKLESGLPDRKLKMVKSYSEKIPASRNSPAYEILHRMIVDEISKAPGALESDAAQDSMGQAG